MSSGRTWPPSVDERPGARGALEREAAAHRGADDDSVDLARRAHELDRPAHDQLVDVDVLDVRLQRAHLFGGDERLERGERMPVSLRQHDLDLGRLVRVAERRAQREAVELRLGERERALLLDRVLGRDHEKRRRQRSRHAVDGHLLLGHRLEERRLRLRHRTVDLVDEHDVREDRPGPELELARLLVVDREPRHVGRLEIGRALDPAKLAPRIVWAIDAREDRLRRAGDVLEQHVPVGRHRREHERDLLVLAEHDPLDVREQTIGGRPRSVAGHGTNRIGCGSRISR